MAQLISRDELALVLDESIDEDRFNALYAVALRLVRTGYTGDPEAATGRALDVITSVVQGVMVRIMTNPKGARTVGLGSANVTFGGAETDIANIFSLSDGERTALADISPTSPDRRAFTVHPAGHGYVTRKVPPPWSRPWYWQGPIR